MRSCVSPMSFWGWDEDMIHLGREDKEAYVYDFINCDQEQSSSWIPDQQPYNPNIIFNDSHYSMKNTFLLPFYIAISLQSSLKVITPFYIIYLVSNGFSLWQIALISSIRSLIWLMFEIPTGAVADIYGKKISVLLWYILSWISLFFIPISDNFWVVALIFALNALFETLYTWADDARISDRIEKENPDLMKSFFLTRRSIRNIGMVFAGILWAGIVHYFGMDSLWRVYGFWFLLAALTLSFVPNGNKGYENEEENFWDKQFWNQISSAFSYLKNNKSLYLLFAGLWLFFILDELTGLLWSPYLKSLNFPEQYFGYLWSVIVGLGALLPLLINKFTTTKKNQSKILILGLFFFFLILIITSFTSSMIWVIICYICYSFIDDLIFPLDDTLTNQILPSDKKATLLSMKSVINNLFSLIGAPIIGSIVWLFTFQIWFHISWLLLLCIITIYYFFWKKYS